MRETGAEGEKAKWEGKKEIGTGDGSGVLDRTECVWCRSARHRLRRVLGGRCIPAHVTLPFACDRALEMCESQAEERETQNRVLCSAVHRVCLCICLCVRAYVRAEERTHSRRTCQTARPFGVAAAGAARGLTTRRCGHRRGTCRPADDTDRTVGAAAQNERLSIGQVGVRRPLSWRRAHTSRPRDGGGCIC